MANSVNTLIYRIYFTIRSKHSGPGIGPERTHEKIADADVPGNTRKGVIVESLNSFE